MEQNPYFWIAGERIPVNQRVHDFDVKTLLPTRGLVLFLVIIIDGKTYIYDKEFVQFVDCTDARWDDCAITSKNMAKKALVAIDELLQFPDFVTFYCLPASARPGPEGESKVVTRKVDGVTVRETHMSEEQTRKLTSTGSIPAVSGKSLWTSVAPAQDQKLDVLELDQRPQRTELAEKFAAVLQHNGYQYAAQFIREKVTDDGELKYPDSADGWLRRIVLATPLERENVIEQARKFLLKK